MNMTKDDIAALMERAADWPAEAQAELVQSMLQIESKYQGVYHLDADERAALARSAEDMRLGRFASDEEVQEVFARFRRA